MTAFPERSRLNRESILRDFLMFPRQGRIIWNGGKKECCKVFCCCRNAEEFRRCWDEDSRSTSHCAKGNG